MAIATDTAYYLSNNPALITLVEQAKTRYPGAADGARIHRAAALVEAGAVTHEGGAWYVLSQGTKYPMLRHICEDIRHEQAPEGRCKHRWAKTLAKTLREKPMEDTRSLEFYADLHGEAGLATVWEDGRILFQAWGSDERIPCSYNEVVLAGRRDLVDEAWK